MPRGRHPPEAFLVELRMAGQQPQSSNTAPAHTLSTMEFRRSSGEKVKMGCEGTEEQNTVVKALAQIALGKIRQGNWAFIASASISCNSDLGSTSYRLFGSQPGERNGQELPDPLADN